MAFYLTCCEMSDIPDSSGILLEESKMPRMDSIFGMQSTCHSIS